MMDNNLTPNGKVLGIDLGGTGLRLGVVEHGRLQPVRTHLVPARASCEEVLDFLTTRIEALIDERVCGIGIGVPSIVAPGSGVVYDTANIPAWRRVPLREILEQKFSVPVTVQNDANCFALGEQLCGEASGASNLVGVCIGTGIGAGWVLNGRLIPGRHGGAGEIGNICYRDSIYEHYCASEFFLRNYACSAQEVHEAALRRERWALHAFGNFGRHLGHALATVMLTYDPEVIVLGGSISQAFQHFITEVRAVIQELPFQSMAREIRIVASRTAHVAVLGAACAWQQEHQPLAASKIA